MIKVIKYNSKLKTDWDNFVDGSKNSTFLFKRDFLEYHKHLFKDYSLLIYDNKKLIGLLPACIENNKKVISHNGLTYGGLIVSKSVKLNTYLKGFKYLLAYLFQNNIEILIYKAIPIFYTIYPSQEEEYALFLVGAKNVRTDTSITIDNSAPLPFQTRRKRSIKSSLKKKFTIKDDNNFRLFWNDILIPNLKKRFNTKPVHRINEIEYLAKIFPKNITQINIYNEENIIAGCTIFETETTAHAQYISANDYGRSSGALDEIFDFLISKKYKHKKYFDFGICNENHGKFINNGLLDWKEGFGGRTFVHKFFKIRTNQFENINNDLISKND